MVLKITSKNKRGKTLRACKGPIKVKIDSLKLLSVYLASNRKAGGYRHYYIHFIRFPINNSFCKLIIKYVIDE